MQTQTQKRNGFFDKSRRALDTAERLTRGRKFRATAEKITTKHISLGSVRALDASQALTIIKDRLRKRGALDRYQNLTVNPSAHTRQQTLFGKPQPGLFEVVAVEKPKKILEKTVIEKFESSPRRVKQLVRGGQWVDGVIVGSSGEYHKIRLADGSIVFSRKGSADLQHINGARSKAIRVRRCACVKNPSCAIGQSSIKSYSVKEHCRSKPIHKRGKKKTATKAKAKRATKRTSSKKGKSLSQYVRAQGGIKPGGMFAGEIRRLSNKETGSSRLVNQNARLSAEYMMDAANTEGYRDKYGLPFEAVGDFLIAVEQDQQGNKKLYTEEANSEFSDDDFERGAAEYHAKKARGETGYEYRPHIRSNPKQNGGRNQKLTPEIMAEVLREFVARKQMTLAEAVNSLANSGFRGVRVGKEKAQKLLAKRNPLHPAIHGGAIGWGIGKVLDKAWDALAAKQKRAKKNPAQKKIKPSPKAQEIFSTFSGRQPRGTVSKVHVSHIAAGKHLAPLGKSPTFYLKDGRVLEMPGRELMSDTRKRLWIAGQTIAKPSKSLTGDQCAPVGEVDEFEYTATKPHLGDPPNTRYIHKAGEDDGAPLDLYVDRNGYPVLRGNGYKITGLGIVN